MAFPKVGLLAVIEGIRKFNRDARLINKRLQEVTGNVKKTEKSARSLTSELKEISPQLRKAGLALTAFGTAGAVFLGKATLLAARVETLGVVTETLGKNIGKTKDEIHGLEKAVADQGITLRAARTSIALMIQSNIDLSNAVNLAAEAQNAAVIAGVDSSEAFRRLVFTITSGNVRMARTLGLQVSFQQAYEKTAASLNKTTLELTQQEKIQARTAEVLRAGTRIVGAYDAAMETAGKKITSLNRHIEESRRAIGEAFVPVLGTAIDALTEFLEGIEDANVAQQRGIAVTLASTTAMAGLSGASLLFLSQLPSLIKGINTLSLALSRFRIVAALGLGTVSLFVAALAALVVAAAKARSENAQLRDDVKNLADEIVQDEGTFRDYEDAIVEAAEGTTLWDLATRQAKNTGETQREAVLRLLVAQGLLTEEMFKSVRTTFRTITAQDALIGSLRGVGTELADQLSDIRLSELSYQDYVRRVEELADANDVAAITTKEFTDAVNQGLNPIDILSRSVLIASERQFDLAAAAESSDKAMLRFAGVASDSVSTVDTLATKLGIGRDRLLEVAKAAGIAIEGLDKIPEDFEIKIQAELDKQAQERIQSQLDDLQFTIDTRLSVDFGEFQTDLEKAEDALAELEIENIEEIAEIRTEGTQALEDQADSIDDLNDRRQDEIFSLRELELRLEKARAKLAEMGDETSELDRRSQKLQIEGLIGDLSGQKESIGELTSEIAELRGGTDDMVAATEQALSDQERIYRDKLQGRVADIDEVTEAWSRQTKEILFNLISQRFAIDGFTDEERLTLIKLAGPQGLGIIDQATADLLEGTDKLNAALLLPGDQSDLIVAAFSDIAEGMIDPTQGALDMAAAFDEAERSVFRLMRSESFEQMMQRGLISQGILQRQRGGPVRRGQPYTVGETGEELFVPSQSGVVIPHNLTSALSGLLTAATSAIPIAGGGSLAGAAAGGTTTNNYTMNLQSAARNEQIAADFNLLALMGERRG